MRALPVIAATDTQASARAFLGVTQSASGNIWLRRPYDARAAGVIAERYGLPQVLAEAVSARGIAPESAGDYLAPTLRALLPDPSHLIDMDKAARRVADAVVAGESIAIFGDYDVDGATSAAQLLRFLRWQKRDATLYVPDRIKEGYGPNAHAMEKLAAAGCKLVVAVDCGTSAHEPLARARALGLDVVVVDHHAAESSLPVATALVNPNRLDETSPCGHLAACGLTFLLLVAVNRILRQAGWYDPASRPEPDLREWLDLVALGTVADVVRLEGLNRAFVAQGLKVIAQRASPGMAALADAASLKQAPGAFALGYMLGPRVNAGGRVGASDTGAKLLAATDPVEAGILARKLDLWNAERQAIEAGVQADALARAQEMAESGRSLLLVSGEGWHPGVIGIVAARIKERFHRPVFVVALDGDIGKGSGRSIEGVDLGAMVIAARQSGLLIAGGGHAMAAGLTVARGAIGDLAAFFEERIAASVSADSFQPRLKLDGLVGMQAASMDFCEMQKKLEPFGNGNPEPRFALASCRISFADTVGDAHIRLTLSDSGGSRLAGIAFKALGTPLGDALLSARRDGAAIHVAGHLRPNVWQGRSSVQMIVEDAALAV